LQTHDTLSALGKPFGIASVAVFGGVPKDPQAKMLKNASKAKNGMTTRIIVGTPGRILDLVQEATCDLSEWVLIGPLSDTRANRCKGSTTLC
jgi:ATP-dependent RNA helicase DBP3